jgi:uncharacterized membrane protein
MMKSITTANVASTTEIPAVTARDPFRWLAKGWRDYRRTPLLSSIYGLVLAGLFYATTYAAWQVPVLVFSFVTGLLLIAPFLATGVYELSRRLERGERPNLHLMLTAGRQNFWSVATFGVLLALILLAWGRLTGLLIALSFPNLGPGDYRLSWDMLLSSDGFGFLILMAMVSLVLAAAAFATSVVSLPLLIDKPIDTITAVAMSWRSVLRNRAVMTVWAAIIVALTFIGIATFYVGLIFILPLIAHASWHAYRSLIAQ